MNMKLARSSFNALKKNNSPLVLARNITSQEVIVKESKYGANNYHPIPVAICRGNGVYLWDMEGKRYWDFLSGFGAVNQGHCHPKLMAAMVEQIKTLHHTSRAFYTDVLGEFAEILCKTFKYDKMLPMNTGVEAGETACKLARKWGYMKKGIPYNKAKIIFAEGNFWGRTLAAVSSSTDPVNYSGYEPLMPGFENIPYNNLNELANALSDPNVCAYMMEPIQGEAGIIVPDDGYLRGVRDICTKNNVLWIADEVQTGLGRTGKLLCVDHEDVRADITVLGKSLAGGLYPVSAVLANEDIMQVMTPGTHGSTFGGNPLGCRVAIEGLKVILDQDLANNAEVVGKMQRERLKPLIGNIVQGVRGKGLMNAIDINPDVINPWDVCIQLQEAGVLTKLTHEKTIRMTPPLTISVSEMNKAMDVVEEVIKAI